MKTLTYNGATFTWKSGRRLASYSKSGTTTTYKYNSDGIRTVKTSGGVTTEYLLNGTNILIEKRSNVTNPLIYVYDSTGTRLGFRYGSGNYYYVYNLQGDVTHIVNSNGDVVAEYTYDSWGNILNASTLTSIGNLNPFRYRGYYYDTESGLYYLNSRYYNPTWGRFINADDESVIGSSNENITINNLFAYCYNNPVNLSDDDGDLPSWATKVLIGTAVIAVVACVISFAAPEIVPFLPSLLFPLIETRGALI